MLGVIKPSEYQSDSDPNRALSAKVKCVVDFFGPTDLRGASFSPAARDHLVPFIGAPPDEALDRYADASPITHVTRDASPVLFVHGNRDALVPLSQSEAMKAALDAAGVENQLVVVRGGDHGLGSAAREDTDAALRSAEKWLIAHLRG